MTEPAASDGSRYEMLGLIARGGMANVYVGRLRGAAGFSRRVAIKQAMEHIASDPVARKMIVEEARLASKIHHPNVVAVQDVEDRDGELLLVMDYVEGASLARLVRAGIKANAPLPAGVVLRITLDACAGLGAAHELRDEAGAPLHIIHRDVSPQNILVGLDGVARLTDFGIAKSVEGAAPATNTGTLKGKVAYMAPEYIEGEDIDARADIFALGVVLWEALARERLFEADRVAQSLHKVLHHEPPPLMDFGLPKAIDEVVQRALEKAPRDRSRSCRELQTALTRAARDTIGVADHAAVATCVDALVGAQLDERRQALRQRVQNLERLAHEREDGTTAAGEEATPLTMPADVGHTLLLDTELSNKEVSTFAASGLSLTPARRRSWWPLAALAVVGSTAAVWAWLSFGEPERVDNVGARAAEAGASSAASTAPASAAEAPASVPAAARTSAIATASASASASATTSAATRAQPPVTRRPGSAAATATPVASQSPSGRQSSSGFAPNPY